MTCLPQNIEWLQIINNRSCDMKCCPNLILKLHCSKKVLFCKVWIIIVLCNFAENVPWPSEQQWSHGRRCTMGHIAQLATMSSQARWWYQARSHLVHIFWYLTHRHAPPSNLHMSDLDSWLDSHSYTLTNILTLLHSLKFEKVWPTTNVGYG